MSEIDQTSYDIGYTDGEFSGHNDWEYALSEIAHIPQEIMERGRIGVAEWLDAELQRNR